MKERPILFNGDMVRAIIEGRKTQTRRVVKPQCSLSDKTGFNWRGWAYGLGFSYFETVRNFAAKNCPYGKVGDRLWVRETCQAAQDGMTFGVNYPADGSTKWLCRSMDSQWLTMYDYRGASGAIIPSIHMRRWASRINLEITGVRVERLNDISEDDAKTEGLKYHPLYKEWGGVEAHPCSTKSLPQWRWYEKPSEAFKNLWESINGNGSWQQNPWVWVIEFKRIQEAA